MDNSVILKKMLVHANKIREYTDGFDQGDLINNSVILEACVFNLSQIGELANLISDEYAKEHREIDWHGMYGLRNRIVHDYDGVNISLVWQIISDDIPELINQIDGLVVEF